MLDFNQTKTDSWARVGLPCPDVARGRQRPVLLFGLDPGVQIFVKFTIELQGLVILLGLVQLPSSTLMNENI